MPEDRFIHKRAGLSDKCSLLTDLEFRVWTQFILSADDFGVMRLSADTLREDNDALKARPVKLVQKALERLVEVGLLLTFEHNRRQYAFQGDWQTFQKVRFPSMTSHPAPPLDACDVNTLWLLTVHPGGERDRSLSSWRAPAAFASQHRAPIARPSRDERAPDALPARDHPAPVARLAHARPLAVSHSLKPLALAVSHGLPDAAAANAPGSPPFAFDTAYAALRDAYPASRKQDSVLIQQAFVRAFEGLENGSREALYGAMLISLEQHKRSAQWQTPKLIPMFGRWVEEKRWIAELPEHEGGEGTTPVTANKYAGIGDG